MAAAMFVVMVVVTACRSAPAVGGPVQHAGLTDGEYVGQAENINKAEVRVTVVGQRLTEVTLLDLDSTSYGDKARGVIPGRIVAEQSTNVDVVAGATEASRVIMNAAEAAVQKSYAAHGQHP